MKSRKHETTRKKGFDCVAMKRRAQAKIHAIIKDMTLEEELAYWNRPQDTALERRSRSQRKRRT